MDSQKASVRELFKQTFKLYQFFYHRPNWKSCPVSIVRKVEKVVQNINLPTSDYSFDTGSFKNKLQGASANFIEEITKICDFHLHDNEPAFPWYEFSHHELFIAIIMAKKQAKKTYRKIDHGLINVLCQFFTDQDPTNFWFQYSNNYVINKSEDITPSRYASSEEFVPSSDNLSDHSDSNTQEISEVNQAKANIVPTSSRSTVHRKSTPKPPKSHPVSHRSTNKNTDMDFNNDSGYKTFLEHSHPGEAHSVTFKFSSSDSNSDSNSDSRYSDAGD